MVCLQEEALIRVKRSGPCALPPQRGCRARNWRGNCSLGSARVLEPRRGWALWRRQGTSQSAVRLHLSLHVVEDKPQRAKITTGRGCERQAWRENWQPGDAYVGDRYYGEDYRLFAKLQEAGCAYVLRLREQAAIKVLEEIELSQTDRQSGVRRQAWVVLGCKARYRSTRVRLVWVETSKEVLLLVTNQEPQEMPAELVAALYRQRWRIELFFRWIKCILGCRHWLAESPRGVAIEIYLALIAALLLQLYSGRRPNRRMLDASPRALSGVPPENRVRRDAEPHTRGRVYSPDALVLASFSETSNENCSRRLRRSFGVGGPIPQPSALNFNVIISAPRRRFFRWRVPLCNAS